MKPVVILSGGRTTQDLTAKLIDTFDVAILEANIANAHKQRFGDAVIVIGALQDEKMRLFAANEAIKHIAFALADGTSAIAARIEALPEWEKYRGNGLAGDLSEWMPVHIHSSIARQINLISTLDKLKSERDVRMVVTHEDVTEVFTDLARWGAVRGIKTLHVPHANPFQLDSVLPDVHAQSVCSHMAATPYMQEHWQRRGFAGEMRLTGSPQFDKWFAYKCEREHARHLFHLTNDKPVVTYATSWGQLTNANDDLSRFEPSLGKMLELAKANDWQLIVKVHPSEQQNIEEMYGGNVKKIGARCLITRLYIEPILVASDVLVAIGPSNLTIEAAMLNVPSVILRMPGYSIQHEAIPEVELSEVGDAVRGVLGDLEGARAKLPGFVYRNAYTFDGKAGDRVAEWIKELA